MKKTILAASLFLFMNTVLASPGDDGCVGNCDDDNGNNSTPGNTSILNTNTSNPTNTNINSSTVSTKSGDSTSSATGGTSKSKSTASASNGNQSTTVNVENSSPGSVRYSGSYSVKSTGVAPDIISSPSAPCRIGIGASAGWLGGAFGIGTSVLDEGCDTREDARMLHNLGQSDAAILRLCQKKEIKKSLGSKCPEEDKPVESNNISSTFNH